ncbi:integrase, partial [Vibrio anguillarum]|nr:integrase [Vibrio anguillarum]
EIAIVDDYKTDNHDWLKIWEKHKVNYQTSFASEETTQFTATIGNKKIRNRSEFNDYLRELQGHCCFLCISLSGMRVGELWGVSTVYGAQNHIKVKGGTIYMFTTKQEKITLDSQTKDDIY